MYRFGKCAECVLEHCVCLFNETTTERPEKAMLLGFLKATLLSSSLDILSLGKCHETSYVVHLVPFHCILTSIASVAFWLILI